MGNLRARIALGTIAAVGGMLGCANTRSPIVPVVNVPLAVPDNEAPPVPEKLPDTNTNTTPSNAELSLTDVLNSLDMHFPLLYAIAQERDIAAGQRQSAEGAFDLNLRSRVSNQEGSFDNNRLDLLLEQASPSNGMTVFGGYRLSGGDFPVYYGDRKTADGGEFRAGVAVPLLRDSAIDRRRAALRQAQIGERLADPVIRRARLDYHRTASRLYWAWVAAGEQLNVAKSLLEIATERQRLIGIQRQGGVRTDIDVMDMARQVAERAEAVASAEQLFQQAALDLSLFTRDANANPLIPRASQLPKQFTTQTPPPELESVWRDDIPLAWQQRPELERFRLLKERVTVDLRLAQNQTMPEVTTGVAVSQDVGNSKKTFIGTGPFASDRTMAEAYINFALPVQRREALGRTRIAQATLIQLLGQEKFAQDQIANDVQQAATAKVQALARLQLARKEVTSAEDAVKKTRELVEGGGGNLFDLNFRELFAAQARVKVIRALADYQRAVADYQAATGRFISDNK